MTEFFRNVGKILPGRCLLTISVLSVLSCNASVIGLRGGGEIIFLGEHIGDKFGSSLDFIGDINGDGNTDIAIGAPYNDTAGTDAGMVYVYFGPFDNTRTSRNPDFRIAGRALSLFGTSIAGGFDFNKDGLCDFAVSSGRSLYGSVNNGDAFVFLGSSTAYASDGIQDAPEFANAHIKTGDLFGLLSVKGFGSVVGLIGDVDRDGIADLGIGAPTSDYSSNSSAGALFIFLGRTIGIAGEIDSTLADYTIVGGSGENLGSSFDYALNLDGQTSGGSPLNDDFVVGGPGKNSAHVFLGPMTKNPYGILSTAYSDRTLQGLSGDDDFGYSVTHLNDIDGDGMDDLSVSSSDGNIQGFYIFYGMQGEAPLPDLYSRIEGTSLSSGASRITSFDEAGGNLVIGAQLGGLGGYEFGAVYLFTSDQLNVIPKGGAYPRSIYESSKLISNPVGLTGSGFAGILSSDGDASGDGLDDLLIGAPLGDVNGDDSGYALLEF